MIEKIGKVTLDDTHYPGRDLYCDGTVEDEILEIVRTNEPSSYGQIIEEQKSWPVLYHLSHLRENIVSWIPMEKTDRVLEVGSGCGAITGALSERAKSVTCVELSKKRSLINAYRHQDCDNVTIKLGNFQEIEPELPADYDYIFLIGVFEYAQSYIGGDDPFAAFLSIMKKHLAPGGRLVIAIENRFGLKYWAGCREDHLGTCFDGIEDYPRGGYVRTFTRKGLEEICKRAQVEEYSFYYPYPDYKFMTTLYSDRRLPKTGELSDNMRNFDRDRMLLFDEKNVFDSLLREELFPQFSNSYVLIVGAELPAVYTRFSNDRAKQYAIRTEIREVGQERTVRKIPMTEEAQAHVSRLEETCRHLEDAYRGSGLLINQCRLEGMEAVLAYLPGRTLEEILDECLDRGDEEGFRRLFWRYVELISYPKEGLYHYDIIFPNFIITEEGWNLIDYEWVTEQAVPARELILRALYCYGIGGEKRKKLCLELMREVSGEAAAFDWDETSLGEIIRREQAFQKHSTGNRMSMVEIRNAIGNPIIPAAEFLHRYMEEEHRNRIQIYEDLGEGFSEQSSYFPIRGYRERKAISVKLEKKPGLQAIRLDPAMDYCLVKVNLLRVGGESISLKGKNVILNGDLISDNTILFATEDPSITITGVNRLDRRSGSEAAHALSDSKAPYALQAEGCEGAVQAPAGLDTGAAWFEAELEVSRLSREMAEAMAAGQREKRKGPKGFSWFRN